MAPARTRSTRSKPVKTAADAVEATESTKPRAELGQNSNDPPKLFVLPKDTSPRARIVTLSSPRDASENRYFYCPERGLYEFTKVAAPSATPRSWLIARHDDTLETQKVADIQKDDKEKDEKIANGYVSRGASLFVATPVDPLFFVLPALCNASPTNSETSKRLFLASDDYLDTMIASSSHFRRILKEESGRKRFESRMAAVCDSVEAGDEVMFRLNEKKLVDEILRKALRMVEKGLPVSMEERFVRKALDVPLIGLTRTLTEQEETEASTPSEDADTQATSTSEASTAVTSVADETDAQPDTSKKGPVLPPINAPEGVPRLLRIRTCLSFILSTYVSPALSKQLKEQFAAPDFKIDFAPLDNHLKYLADLRSQAMLSRTAGESNANKRMAADEEDGWEERAEKKRRMEEEEKKKKATKSVGVRKLEKVNTTGMKKMSDFFKKK